MNTHNHLDHAFGNCVFAKLGAVVISQEKDREGLEKIAATALKDAVAFGVTAELLQGTTISVPTISFTQAARVDLGGIAVELISAVPSHSPGSAFVLVPSRKVVFAGDVAGWVKALDALATLDVTAIVPGHGPLSTKKDLQEMQAYITTFDAKAREMAKTGASAEAIVAELKKIFPVLQIALDEQFNAVGADDPAFGCRLQRVLHQVAEHAPDDHPSAADG